MQRFVAIALREQITADIPQRMVDALSAAPVVVGDILGFGRRQRHAAVSGITALNPPPPPRPGQPRRTTPWHLAVRSVSSAAR